MVVEQVMVIAAHPDDETLGCGATMAKHIQNGDNVSVIILGTGISSRKDIGIDISNELNDLRIGSKKAMHALGVENIKWLDFPDNSFDSIPLLSIAKAIEKEVKEKNPTIIYTHHFGDLNIDHRRTHQAVMTACRPTTCDVKKIACFEVVSSTEWQTPDRSLCFCPNFYSEINDIQLENKILALLEYEGELRQPPHPRSADGIRTLAKLRGYQMGLKYAEAFELIRSIEEVPSC